MSITYLAGARILDQQFGAVSPTVPATYYLFLSTTTIVDAGTGYTEPSTSGTGYARVAVANNKISWGNASSNSLSNLIEISFPISTASWGTITYIGISDSGTVGAGNVLFFAPLTPNRAIASGTTPYFGIGDITVSITNA